MRSLSQPTRMRTNQPQCLVIIDARHTLYQYQRGDQVIYDPLIFKFLEMIQSETKHFYFLFTHKQLEKNKRLKAQFQERCNQHKHSLIKNIIVSNDPFTSIKNLIQEFLAMVQPSFAARGSVTQVRQQPNKLIIVTHNPITFKFAQLTRYINHYKQPFNFETYLFYFSSYFQDASKKQIIEEHFYKYNFASNNNRFKFLHISSLVQLLPYINQLRPEDRLNVGYYFYPKKHNELLMHGILINSDQVTLVPIDMRFYNREQYKFIKVLFQKLLDLNKTKEIKFTPSEVMAFKKNYEQFVRDYSVMNIDPITMIPIIAQRIQFQQLFDKIFESSQAQRIMSQTGYQYKTPSFGEINNSNQMNGYHFDEFKFPSIVKTKAAAFTPNCHIMGITVSEEGLKQILLKDDFKYIQFVIVLGQNWLFNKQSIITESFIKYIALGSMSSFKSESLFLTQRNRILHHLRLLKHHNFQGFYIFDSQQDMFKQVSSSLKVVQEPKIDITVDPKLEESIKGISQLIRKEFQLSLFGFDIIQDYKSKDCYIIDINHFPGYKNVANLKQIFDQLFLEGQQ